VLQHADRTDHERAVATVILALSLETFESAWAQGRALSLDQAVACALGE
jgi:hypothetical protein